jgi:arylsulfatase A-like enzyme
MGLNNHNVWNLNEDEITFTGRMRDAGYETRCFGTWHINHDPRIFGIEERVDDRPAADIAGLFEEFIATRRAEKPFLAYIGFFEPHRDFGIDSYPPVNPEEVWIPPYLPDNEFTRKDLAQFHAAIREMDAAVGRILQTIDKHGLARDTVVIFTADHGIAFPRAKCTLYDPGIRTPLIITWPGVLPSNAVFQQLMSNVDFAPSLLDLLGLQPIPNAHGKSFLPLFNNGEYLPNECIFAEKTYHNIYDPMRAIRTDDHKYIINYEEGPAFVMPTDVSISLTAQGMNQREIFQLRPPGELYDLNKDPHESTNLVADPEYRAVCDDLHSRLMEFLRETRDPILEGPIPDQPSF